MFPETKSRETLRAVGKLALSKEADVKCFVI